MKKTTMRVFVLALLTMFSMGAGAKIDLQIANDGKFDGGTIEVTDQKDLDDGMEVTITVTPKDGYTITKDAIIVVSTYPPSGARSDTRAPEIAENLKLYYKGSAEKDVDDSTAKRDYTFIVPTGFGAWVKEAKFSSDSKGGEPTRDGFSGVYYIANDNSATGSDDGTKYSEATADIQKYYLVPADNPQQENKIDAYYSPNHASGNGDSEKPFLTTFHTNKDLNSIWIVQKTGNYYYVIHAITGKYVIYEVPLPNDPDTNTNSDQTKNGKRKTMHLQTPDDEEGEGTYRLSANNNFQFTITKDNDNIYRFQPRNRSKWYWNPANGNKNKYYGQTASIYQSGLVGVFNGVNDGGSKWHFEDAKLPAPTIEYDSENDKFIISYDKIPAGFEILYTKDGSNPTIGGATTQTYTNESAITLATIGENPLKAVVVRYGLILTETAIIRKPTNPTITATPGDCNNTVTISAGEGTSIYYTIDGTTPTNSSTLYTVPFVLNSDATIKAVAYSGNLHSEVISLDYTPNYSNKPSITQKGATITITGTGIIYYTLDGSNPDTGSTLYDGPFTLSGNSGDLITIKAVAKDGDKELSCVVEKTVTMGYFISNLSQLQAISSHLNELCIVTSDIDASTLSSSISDFTGVFDGDYYTISGLTKPLFDNLNGATVKNVLLDPNATVSGNGAICNEAEGATKIYNCGVLSGEISGSDNVGGLVGHIKSGSSVRVVNCYNYANVSGSDYAAGIVGYNEGTVGDVRIAMCMMYGSVSGATNISPVYGGNHVSNAQNFTEYNYYLFSNERDANGNRIVKIPYTAYNDQLAIDNDVYLTRFPFYRYILNNHRELASYFLFGDYDSNHIEEVGHWIRKKGDNVPQYPIIEKWEVNRKSTPTQTNNNLPNTTEDYAGKLLTAMGNSGYLSVSIKIGSNSYSTSLPITDMDTKRFDYNYGKVILPFANEYEINTDYSRICTGWKITGVTGGTAGTVTNYNFADRNCTAKDVYNESTNPFIFAQGGYYIVPTGVTGISIEANFATAYYLSDATYEIGYNSSYDGRTGLGGSTPTEFHGETVYNSLVTVVSNLATTTTNPHKQAIVLVGNYHYDLAKDALATGKGFTLMSIDADNNQEPDYGFYSIAPDRPQTPALRFDFVPIVSLGMAAKVNGSVYYPGVPIWKPRGWYEQTETTVSIMNQFELDSGYFTNDEDGNGQNPCIINGGYFVQMIRSNNTNCSKVSYFKIGGNTYIKEFFPGSHSNKGDKWATLVPVNVTGGQVDECYMTGYKSGAVAIGPDIRFWCSGGKIGKFLGAYMDKPKQTSENDGNVNMTAHVDHALIGRFFGGGTSPSAAITGDINVTINNSKVDFYCGGPEFGDMISGKVVTTNANNTTFGEYYGAGFGGTAITYSPVDGTPTIGASVTFPSKSYTYGSSRLKNSGSLGLATCYKFEYLMHSANKAMLVARFITGYANFNLATTGDVTNNLTGCTIEKDFYGAGCQGKVNGAVTSTLTSCTLKGSAFGGGYKAVSNEVKVYPAAAPTLSTYNGETGLFSEFGTTEPETYTWEQGTGTTPTADQGNKKLKTSNSVTMSELGNVTGAISLTIDGGSVEENVFGGGNESKSLDNTTVVIQNGTTVGQSVYGGGNLADVNGSTSVNVTGGTIGSANAPIYGELVGNVYGGGKGKNDDKLAGLVKGNTNISISGTPTIYHNVYGGGAYGSVGTFTYADDDYHTAHPEVSVGMPTACAENTGACTVTITGGTFGWNGKENGMVFGSSRGDVATPEGEPAIDPNDRMAWVYSTQVNIGTDGSATGPTIKGSVYGSGENGHTFNDTELNIYSGTIGIPTGEAITDNNGTPDDTSDDKSYSGANYPYRGNVYGGGCGTDTYTGTDSKSHYNPLAGIVRGTTTVNIKGGHVVRNVYGAGAMGSVGGGTTDEAGKTSINVTGGRIGYDGNCNNDGCIFGAARGEYGVSVAGSNLANVRETKVNINYTTTPAKDNEDKTEKLIAGSVFGGGEAGTVEGSVAVTMTGGLILKDIYGGGALADTQTGNWGASGWADADKKSSLYTTTVRATGGIVKEEIFGGALGEAGTTQNPTGKPAYVWGDVLVDLNGTTTMSDGKPTTEGNAIADNAKGCAVYRVFGCNNANGTPKGDVLVHIYATQNTAATQIANIPATGKEGEEGYVPGDDTQKVKNRYDIAAVYGGGNEAAYNPVIPNTSTTTVPNGSRTRVIIDGCARTSINTVYGGGNAAAVPETNVNIRGTFEIFNVFGGGNGKDKKSDGSDNPGADVGTLDQGTSEYGTGNVNTLLEGGLIHEAYGGSNQKGIIKGAINLTSDPKDPDVYPDCCELAVEKIVGAGKYADIDGDVNMTLSCQPNRKVNMLFAGADEANVNGNITLNITNGHFGQVFGGNNLGGAIKGKITVNVEETGCQPIKIDNLYLGSNKAAYSVFGYYDSKVPHSVTGKNILKPRESATDARKPVKHDGTEYASINDFTNYPQPELNIISCTYIGNVFGGGLGEEAVMYANPTVNINLKPGEYANDIPSFMEGLRLVASENPDKLGIIENVYGGGDAANIEGNTTVNIATETGKGAYIIGNVFGGGNGVMDNLDLGKIIGNTHVIIGDGTDNANLHIKCSAYGGGNIGMVTGNTVVDVNNGIIGTNQEGGYKWGNVYGGGKGKIVETEGQSAQLVMNSIADVDAGLVKGNTTITINGTATTTQILHNVYGGGAVGSVGTFTRDANGMPTECTSGGLATVTINGGKIGHDRKDTGMVNGSSRGWEGNPEGSYLNQLAWVNNTNVIIGDVSSDAGPSILGSVYGGGENGHNFKNGVVTVNKGTIGYEEGTWDCGNIYGAGCGTDTYTIGESTTEHHNPMAGCVRGTTSITVNGGNILRNVYGGGSMGSVGTYTYDANGLPTTCAAGTGNTTININGGMIGQLDKDYGYVFGGPKGNLSETEFFASVRETQVNINAGADIKRSVFGGGEAGIVKGSVVVNMNGGEVTQDVYGGGALANTNTDNWGTTTWATGKTSASNTTTINLKGGKVNRNVYGGGLGQTADTEKGLEDVEAKVYGNVLVELNNGVADDAKGCVVLGSIFGCNNLNGTPMGDVKVHVNKTQNVAASTIANPAVGEKTAKVAGRYDIAAVYGGGNQSAYEPAADNNKTEVIIDGCQLTSIKQVYGGGNAACTPSTSVTVNGTFEIEELFGGGNGLDKILINGVEMPNPGANVGYKNYSEYYKEDGSDTWKVRDKANADTKEKRMASSSPYIYGTGKASVNIYGGTVHHVFGGSNTKGNVRQTAVTLLEELEGEDCCPFKVDEAYGGGKSAEMDAEAQLLMACIPGLQAVYGGAEAADVRGNVTLNITNGTFDRVFGGNNVSGTISGAITINVEEIGCKPVKIGQLYGGGNLAGYSVYGYDSGGQPKETGDRLYDDPQINVMSFTSIGNIYGGGYGNTAVMVGNPTVNVNEVYGKYYNDDVSVVGENAKTPNGYPIPSHAKGKMGAISEIFGGGNAAKVIGNTTVNIGTQSEVYVVKQVTSGATLPDGCYTRNDDGTYDSATGTASADITYYEKKDVLGADIRGNVYGGGNEAEVTGNTDVVIGKRTE